VGHPATVSSFWVQPVLTPWALAAFTRGGLGRRFLYNILAPCQVGSSLCSDFGTSVEKPEALYCVNFEVNPAKPFPHLAFPQMIGSKIGPKQGSLDGEFLASCYSEDSILANSCGHSNLISGRVDAAHLGALRF
jgi:hypothetical protein